jgi:hypothetical protein
MGQISMDHAMSGGSIEPSILLAIEKGHLQDRVANPAAVVESVLPKKAQNNIFLCWRKMLLVNCVGMERTTATVA